MNNQMSWGSAFRQTTLFQFTPPFHIIAVTFLLVRYVPYYYLHLFQKIASQNGFAPKMDSQLHSMVPWKRGRENDPPPIKIRGLHTYFDFDTLMHGNNAATAAAQTMAVVIGGTQVSSRQFIFWNHKKIRPEFYVTCLVDSHENKSLFTSPPSIGRCTLPPPPCTLYPPPCAKESIDLSSLEHAASPGECSNVGRFFYFTLLAAQHCANHNAR